MFKLIKIYNLFWRSSFLSYIMIHNLWIYKETTNIKIWRSIIFFLWIKLTLHSFQLFFFSPQSLKWKIQIKVFQPSIMNKGFLNLRCGKSKNTPKYRNFHIIWTICLNDILKFYLSANYPVVVRCLNPIIFLKTSANVLKLKLNKSSEFLFILLFQSQPFIFILWQTIHCIVIFKILTFLKFYVKDFLRIKNRIRRIIY